jgi:hypothetical protein
MSDDKISSALGIRPMSEIDENEISTEIEYVEPHNPPVVISAEDDENLRDLDTVRTNIQGVIATGQDAMQEMLEIAKQSEQPRAFEVVSTLMKTMLDANKDFADISSKKKFAQEEINAPREAAQTNTVNNNLIVSTADLLKLIKGDNDG